MQNSSREPVEGREALALLAGVSELIVAKGRKTLRYDLAGKRPSDAELLGVLLGRSGKLRAPSMRLGAKFLVGYNSVMLATEL